MKDIIIFDVWWPVFQIMSHDTDLNFFDKCPIFTQNTRNILNIANVKIKFIKIKKN